MLGAIAGDIVGSPYELSNCRGTDFPLFGEGSHFTDDSVMTIAVAAALCDGPRDPAAVGARAAQWMRRLGRAYPGCGYGRQFAAWLRSDTMGPYGSMGNGAAMRVSPCAHV
nr:ADP-ribosylglycohydrolase family protein [Succinivibrionaceae bacterium]